jgi:hypothetical protein
MLFPEQVKHFRACPGEIASMHLPESPVFNGLESLDLAWFELKRGPNSQGMSGYLSN